MRETALKSKVADELRKKHGCFVIALAGSQFQQPGLPDLYILKDGVHIFVECKNPDTPTKGIQDRIKIQIKQNGGKCFELRFSRDHEWVIDDFYQVKFKLFREGVKTLLDTLLELAKPKPEFSTQEIFK